MVRWLAAASYLSQPGSLGSEQVRIEHLYRGIGFSSRTENGTRHGRDGVGVRAEFVCRDAHRLHGPRLTPSQRHSGDRGQHPAPATQRIAEIQSVYHVLVALCTCRARRANDSKRISGILYLARPGIAERARLSLESATPVPQFRIVRHDLRQTFGNFYGGVQVVRGRAPPGAQRAGDA